MLPIPPPLPRSFTMLFLFQVVGKYLCFHTFSEHIHGTQSLRDIIFNDTLKESLEIHNSRGFPFIYLVPNYLLKNARKDLN